MAVDSVEERHRHRYEINPKYVDDLEKAGMRFVGHSTDNTRMEIVEIPGTREGFYTLSLCARRVLQFLVSLLQIIPIMWVCSTTLST